MHDYSAAAPAMVPQRALDSLHFRLENYRESPVAAARAWTRGVDRAYLAELMDYWKKEYDWRVHEERIRRYPWVTAGRQRPVRAIHHRVGAGEPTVVLLHGWPDSILRFERLLPELRNVNVVVPALPGFPFALPVPEGGLGAVPMASIIGDALEDMGYDEYILSAGDVGCDVAEVLAATRRDEVVALHLTDVSQGHYLRNPPTDLTDVEQAYVRYGAQWQAGEGGYMHEQATKSHTLATALGDSPAGLAAWILEKLHGWTDNDGDVETVFSKDDLLTWISAYWFDNCIGTSFSPYAEGADMAWARIEAPTAITVFPRDLVNAPREFADRYFNVQFWREFDRGGHFAAFERPQDYLVGVREALALAVRH